MSTERRSLAALIRLQAAIGFANVKAKQQLSLFGDACNILSADDKVRRISGLFTARQLSKFAQYDEAYAEQILEQCEKNGIRIICIEDDEYPECLRNIADPPLVLYIKGEWQNFDAEPAFCIVGPRKVSEFGAKAAFSLGYRLARGGITIVSGGAVGSDFYAHKGAIRAHGKTFAVLPCGILCDYLSVNRPLREEIVASGGCLISECPPEFGVAAYSFPVRNRLLSALCPGTAVIEAGSRSGALITARHACEQGKEVFVIPGNPTAPQYKGSNELLRDGARPLLDANDIFSAYLSAFGDKIDCKRAFSPSDEASKPENNKKFQKKSDIGLSKEAKIVYNSLDKLKFSADEIPAVGISDDELLAALTELEMEGYIAALPGGLYKLL